MLAEAILIYENDGFINAIFKNDKAGNIQAEDIKKTNILANIKFIKIDTDVATRAEYKIRFLVGENFKIKSDDEIMDSDFFYFQLNEDTLQEVPITEKIKLRFSKNDIKKQVLNYNIGSEQKDITINNKKYRFRKETRISMSARFQRELAQGKETTYFSEYECDINKAIELLNDIEDYITHCYDTTNIIIKKIDEMITIEELSSFDWKKLYLETPSYTI